MEGIETEILGIVKGIWDAILGLEVGEGSRALEAAMKIQSERSLTSCVQVTGTFEGTVLLYCTHSLAERMASIMFDVAVADLSEDEVEDSMGELGNMTAGNIKLLLPRPSNISLPAVVNGIDYRLLVPGSRVCGKVLVECQGEPILVTLLQKENGHPAHLAKGH